MARTATEVVLITGGSGFLGQHIVKHLQELENDVKEIRVLDLVAYENKLGHKETKPLVSIIGDISEAETIEKAFEGVDVVFHCAAFINFQHPPNINQLELININGTKNIVNLCIKHNVHRLIYTSCASVVLTPYLGKATFAVVVNQTESKAKTPVVDSSFIVPGYSSSKLRAEKIVLGAHGTNLSNGTGELITVALRPSIMYGEEDHRFFPAVAKVAHKFGDVIPKVLGAGGKHQQAYAGNIAWAHIRAMETLKTAPKGIAGLPVFITDDTPVEDTSRFCQRISRAQDTFNIRPTSWTIPSFFAYFLAFLLESIVSFLYQICGLTLPFQPRALVGYAGSMIMYSRLRADINMDYVPLYDEEKSIQNSAKWYEKWYRKHFKVTGSKDKSQ